MRFEQLEYFHALVFSKTIQAVSEKFYTSPQVVSKAIKQLEEELDTTLFSRTRKGLTLTEDGIELYPHVEALLSHYHFIRKTFIEEKPALQIQDLNVISSKGTFSYFSDLMRKIDIATPNTHCNITMNITTAQEIKKLIYTKHNYDIIATVLSDAELKIFQQESYISKKYIAHTIYRDKTKLWVNKNSQYASDGKISYKQLKKIPLIRYVLNDPLEDYLKETYNIQLSYPYQFTEIAMAIDLIQENKGGFFAPENYITRAFPVTLLKNIVAIDLDIDFYLSAVLFINKKKLNNLSFAAIVAELTELNTC